MKKFLMILALASACLLSAAIPARADGVIIQCRTSPPPPVENSNTTASKTSDDLPDFWDFLKYFGLS